MDLRTFAFALAVSSEPTQDDRHFLDLGLVTYALDLHSIERICPAIFERVLTLKIERKTVLTSPQVGTDRGLPWALALALAGAMAGALAMALGAAHGAPRAAR